MMKTLVRFSPFVLLAAAGPLLAAPAAPTRPAPRPAEAGARRAASAYLSPGLTAKLAATPDLNSPVGTVIVAFRTVGGLADVAGLDALLASVGITIDATHGHRFESLGMISAVLTPAQITALQGNPLVRSMTDNHRLYYNLHQARVLCGVDKLRADAAMTTRNGGRIIDGTAAGQQITVAVIDSGIDTTNLDLPFDMASAATGVPTTGKVVQNVQVVGDSATGTVTTAPLQINDDTVAHGTHCAGIVGGTGGSSRTTAGTTYPSAGQTEDFSGVAGRFTGTAATDLTSPTAKLTTASGVKMLGLGSGAGLFILDALGGFDYVLANQVKYNVRVTSNSYGSQGAYSPDDALEIAVKKAYDANITNVFANGNSGPGADTMSSNPKSPWVIAVAAGTKEGGLASFSSRGLPASQRTGDAVAMDGTHYNPNLFNLPAITAPGTGREFLFDGPYDPAATSPYVSGVTAPNPDTVGKKFYSDMISTLSKTGTAARGTNDQEFPTPYQSNYTMISGTSMACPFVAGACALLLSVDPTLTPAKIKAIMQATATHLPDYQDFEVGAGYLNVYAAVDQALNPTKPYAPFNRIEAPYASAYPAFITTINSGPVPASAVSRPANYPPATLTVGSSQDEDFTLPYNPQSVAAASYTAALNKAKTNDNAYAFLVDANADGTPNASLPTTLKTTMLDVRIQFGMDSAAGVAGGNTIGLLLWAPDGTMYSSGIALPVEDAPTREAVVKSPKPGLWVAELRGLRGLAAIPLTPPTGVGLPDTTTGQIYRNNSTVTNPPTDLGGIPQAAAINTALLSRFFDQKTSGLFNPSSAVTRTEFAQALADNTPLRQSLNATTSAYTDASGATARYAEAAAQKGSTLRDWDFTPDPVLATNSAAFSGTNVVSRFDVATAFVRALGLDPEALHLAGTAVKVTYQGALISVTDANLLAPAQRGYLQLALDRGLLVPVIQYNAGTATYTALALPTKAITRADLAVALVGFRGIFPFGNTLTATEYAPQPN